MLMAENMKLWAYSSEKIYRVPNPNGMTIVKTFKAYNVL